MNLQEFQDLCYLYALGLLEPEEKSQFLEELRKGGEPYQAALNQALALNASILTAVDSVEPPQRLRAKVIAALTGTAQRNFSWSWIWAPLAASFLAIAIWQGSVAQRNAAELNEVQTFLSDPQTKVAGAGQGTASYYVNASRGVVLIAQDLAASKAGRTYQMWIIPKGQNPRPAGLFKADQSGKAIHVYSGTVDINTIGALAISDEPDAGSAQPTTTPQLVAPFSGP